MGQKSNLDEPLLNEMIDRIGIDMILAILADLCTARAMEAHENDDDSNEAIWDDNAERIGKIIKT